MSSLHLCLGLIALSAPPVASPAPDDVEDGSESGTNRATSDGDSILGVWLGAELVDDARYVLIFTPDRLEAGVDDDRLRFTWSIDPTTSPRSITLVTTDEDEDVHRGIYELRGDHLVLCVAEEPSGPRPTEFKSHDDVALLRLSRPEDSRPDGRE